ncbi:MAG: DNA recombination protein RmuC [Dysgonamonadaceae bacterium]|nr:DNA recombination protein RmuC [Dysgonamonadaceae bacterium]
MTTILLIVLIVLALLNGILTLTKKSKDNSEEMKTGFIKLDAGLSKIDPLVRDEFGRNREESRNSLKENREELNVSFKLLGDTLTKTVAELSNAQKAQFETFSGRQEQIRKDSTETLKEIRETVEKKLQTLQDENNKKLDEMRKVVDEKLQETVEKRFNESFKMINDRLEEVHKGLGEMQSLASGVGDLKKVLTNVKTRGNLGEIQLGAILEQILSPEQYEQNAAIKEGSQERVEYVIKLPGKNHDNKSLLLPIDSKFPNEDYQRLLEAYENMANLNPRDVEAASKQFENSVKKNAKDIRDKYINPPVTTDFAIMFVPTEGLYAEILRRTGLFETLQREYKITVVGPTNLVAFLSSLQMGFKTLAIEKRSSEVWEVLGAVKTEFGNFGIVLEKTKKKLEEATNVIDKAGVRSRAIERKLRTVQELPQEKTLELLGEAIEIEQDSDIETI